MEAIHLYIAARKLGEEISRLKARTRESLALDLVPYIGTGKSVIELYQGKNLLTGEELDGWDYAFGAAGTVLPLLKAGRRLFKIFKGADNIEEAVDAGKITEDVGKKIEGTGNFPSNFADRAKLESHFDKHGGEFGGIYKNADEYLDGAKDVINNGIKVQYEYKGETRTGYVRFMGNNKDGNAKFEFVGTNNNGEITTYHTQSGKKFWKTINGENVPVINPAE
jgi:hypothetical protein